MATRSSDTVPSRIATTTKHSSRSTTAPQQEDHLAKDVLAVRIPLRAQALKLKMLRDSFLGCLVTLRDTVRCVEAAALSKEDLSDLVLLMRDSIELAKDAGKEFNAAMDTAGDMAALMHTADGSDGTVKGAISVGTIRYRIQPKLPSKTKEPERHLQLLQALGFMGNQPDLISLNWPRLVEKLSADYAAGIPLPAGIQPEDLQAKPKLEVRRASTSS